ncbi:BTAD domain-containing putative transcriptional regulator [Kribbella sp. NPDC004536]|uniref:AfsR/SARP family transcriptional regulator n=1 Tax=Kribbella sp. NPDC004536 TaxID=3364106 RepID=UPI0036C1BF79
MEFRLLGPVQIWSGTGLVDLKRRQERLLLAVLLLEPGRPVPAERLIELLWPDALPANPRRALQVYVSRLRSVLDVELTSGRDGYAIRSRPGQTDVEQFRSVVEQARRQDDLEQRSKLLADALALWRGPALADVTTDDVRRRLCRGLDEAKLAAQELRLTTELALGHHQELLAELADLTAAEPSRETFAAARMLALYRSGRQADALAAYADVVRHLDDELGVEPGADLRDLQVAILRQDSSLDLTAASAVPRELPADIGLLLGRDDVLEEAADVLLRSGRRSGVPAVVCLYGAAGTGKSAAAVRLGHQLADSYPDGQLFVRLQDVDGQAIPPSTILGRLLRSLDVDEIPDGLEARSGLLRTRLAGQNVLLVFDDALDAGQLRPLLPADDGCGVVVTSRRPMLGLEDATHRELLPLPDGTSAELLGALSGLGGAAVGDVVPYCAGLPLALRIVGARLALIREDVADVVRILDDESRRLDYLVAGDRAVRASLDLSLSVASGIARELFARLAVVGADEFAPWVAAPLLDQDEASAAAVLENLVALGLVQQRRIDPPRYGLHGLVRGYAVELFGPAGEPALERRYLDTVLRLVTIADEHIDHGAVILELDRGGDFELPDAELRAEAGAAWLDVEGPVVRAAVERALVRWPRLGAMLALRFTGYLAVRDDREVRRSVLEDARQVAETAGEVDLEAELGRCLFAALAQAGAPPEELRPVAERARTAADRSGVVALRVGARNQLGWLAAAAGDFEGKLRVGEEMLAIVDSDPEAEALRSRALDQIGGALLLLGRVPESLVFRREVCRLDEPGTRLRAIRLVLLAETLLADDDLGAAHVAELAVVLADARAIIERIGDELGSAHVDNTEAQLLVLTGRPAEAEVLLRRSAEVLSRRPDESGEGANAIGWARLQVAAGRPDEARRTLATAVGRAGSSAFTRRELRHQQRLLGLV